MKLSHKKMDSICAFLSVLAISMGGLIYRIDVGAAITLWIFGLTLGLQYSKFIVISQKEYDGINE